jgi:hypothetical protein
VYDFVGTFIHHLPRHIKLLMNVVPRVLSFAKAMIHDLQLLVLLGRRNCTTTEKVILTLQLCALLISGHAETLLDDYRVSVVLQVEKTLGILCHRSHAYVVMWTAMK